MGEASGEGAGCMGIALRAVSFSPGSGFTEARCERSSPRPISTGELNALLRLHCRPIYLVIFKGSYPVGPVGGLILGPVSRLDAFSAYPIRTWLSGCATGVTTGSPEVRPSRSSRTRDRAPQTSCARDR